VTARSGAGLLDDLPRLRPGPWWPELDRVLADLDRLVPDTDALVAATGRAQLVAPAGADDVARPG
jgi:hypothetical protein